MSTGKIISDQQDTAFRQHAMVHYIIPPFSRSRVVYATGNILKQVYYHSYNCPGYIFMREEYGLQPRHFSFITYILEAGERELVVLSCTEHNHYEITGFNSGYTYIRLPSGFGTTEEWEYSPGDRIQVICRSRITTRDIDGKLYQELQVDRKTIYTEGQISSTDHTIEHYIAGIGIYHIEYVPGKKRLDHVC